MALIFLAFAAVYDCAAAGVGLDGEVEMVCARDGNVVGKLGHLNAVELHKLDEFSAILVYKVVCSHGLDVGGYEGSPIFGLIVHRCAVLDGIGIALVVVQALADNGAVLAGLIGENGQGVLALKGHGGHFGVEGHEVLFGIDALCGAGL